MIKRLLMALGFLTIGTIAFPAGNSVGWVASTGTYTAQQIETYQNNSGNFRQAIVVGDATSSATVRADPVQGMQVYLGTSTVVAGQFILSQPSVLGATVTYNGVQTVTIGNFVTTHTVIQANALNVVSTNTYATIIQPSVLGATVTYNGQQAVLVSTLQVITNSGGQGSVGYHSQASSVPVNVLNTVGITGSISNTGFNVNNTVAVSNVSSTNTYITNLTSVTFNSVSQPVNITANVPNVSSTNTYITNLTSVTFNSVSQPVNITANVPNVSSTNTYITNVTTTTDRLLVSSNTAFPTSAADAAQTQILGDNKGRIINLPLADWGKVKVATATLTTNVNEIVFISSGGSGITNHLIGCIGENTSATATDITLHGEGNGSDTGVIKLGMSASNVPVGFFPPMGIYQSHANTIWTIKGGASVTSLNITCWYFPYAP